MRAQLEYEIKQATEGLERIASTFHRSWEAGAANVALSAIKQLQEALQAEPIGYHLISSPAIFYPADRKPTDIENFREVFARPVVRPAPVDALAVNAIEQEMDVLRQEQVERVMPLIGPLLDAYEGTQKKDLEDLSPSLVRNLKAINHAMSKEQKP